MLKKGINKDWLRKHGVEGPDEDLDWLVAHAEAALELRVGTALMELFTDEQVDAFDELGESEENADARLELLESVVPDYSSFVYREQSRLKRNIARAKDPAAYIRKLDT